GQDLTQGRLLARDKRRRLDFGGNLDRQALGLSLIPPLGLSERNRLLDDLSQIDDRKLFIGFSGPIEFAETADDGGGVLGRCAQHFEATARLHLVIKQLITLQEQIRESENRREVIVKVVGNPAGHLADGAEAFLLNDLLLGGL